MRADFENDQAILDRVIESKEYEALVNFGRSNLISPTRKATHKTGELRYISSPKEPNPCLCSILGFAEGFLSAK